MRFFVLLLVALLSPTWRVEGAPSGMLALYVYPFAFSSYCQDAFLKAQPWTPELGGTEQSAGCFADRTQVVGGADHQGRMEVSNVFFSESVRGASQDMVDNGLSLLLRQRQQQQKEEEERSGTTKKDGFFEDLLGTMAVSQITFEKSPDSASPQLFQIMSQFGNNAIFHGNYSCINWPLALLQFDLPIQRHSPNERFVITVEGVLSGFSFTGRTSGATGFEFKEKLTVDVSYIDFHYSSTARTYGNTPSTVSNFLHFNSRYIDNLGGDTPFCTDVGVFLPLFS